jgi:hypothetical protein
MKAEYKEGKEARENFEKLAKKLFQAPKSAVSAARHTTQNTTLETLAWHPLGLFLLGTSVRYQRSKSFTLL